MQTRAAYVWYADTQTRAAYVWYADTQTRATYVWYADTQTRAASVLYAVTQIKAAYGSVILLGRHYRRCIRLVGITNTAHGPLELPSIKEIHPDPYP
jgi:hypothetical protein